MCTLHLLNHLSRVYLFGPLELVKGDFPSGGRGGFLPPPPPNFSPREDGVGAERGSLWVGRSHSWITKPGMEEEQDGPVCLNTPEAGLGDIFLMGGYLVEVNSSVGFGLMLMRPRLYKGQLVSFCSLCYKPPPIGGQASHKCRERGNETA